MAHNRDAYQDAINDLRAQLRDLEARRGKLLTAIEALQEVKPKQQRRQRRSGPRRAHRGEASTPSAVPVSQAGGNGKPGTLTEAAASLLREAGRPLHIMEIADRIHQRWYPEREAKLIRQSLSGMLENKAEKHKVFKKTARATFGLIEGGPAR